MQLLVACLAKSKSAKVVLVRTALLADFDLGRMRESEDPPDVRSDASVVAVPILGGLHHQYVRIGFSERTAKENGHITLLDRRPGLRHGADGRRRASTIVEKPERREHSHQVGTELGNPYPRKFSHLFGCACSGGTYDAGCRTKYHPLLHTKTSQDGHQRCGSHCSSCCRQPCAVACAVEQSNALRLQTVRRHRSRPPPLLRALEVRPCRIVMLMLCLPS
jgi:hypothetical protein